MSELTRLQELNSRLQLVPRGTTVAELQRNASDFTNEAAKMLHGEGWRRIRKTNGTNIDGLDIDKLVNVHTFQVVDIIVSAGAPNAFVAWQLAGELRDTSRFVEVRPTPSEPPAPTNPPASEDTLLLEVADAIDSSTDAIRSLDRTVVALRTELALLRDLIERVVARFPF